MVLDMGSKVVSGDGARDEVLRLAAVGDVQPHRKRPEELFELVHDDLAWADLRMCQLEATLSRLGQARTDVRNPAHRVPPENVAALTRAGFDLITFAGNNNIDYGLEAFYDTIELCESNGIRIVGGGRNLAEARRPVVMTVRGVRVAFMNFCSILRDGYAATDDRGGISPLRVATFYEPLENIYEQPGTPARTRTVMDQGDLDAALAGIARAREDADVVVASFHWGVHFTHDLAEYQPELGYAAIDAGADVVIGTHPHCLQAIDVYRGKPILYSLGNFAFEQPEAIARHGVGEYLSFYDIPLEADLTQHPHPRHCRMTVIAKLTISRAGVEEVSLVPAYFNDAAQPEPLEPGAPKRDEVVGLMQALCAEIGTTLEDRGRELVVRLDQPDGPDTRTLIQRRKASYPWLQRLVALGPDRYVIRGEETQHELEPTA
jgi:poly-gamma-glutamate capsule biosynthesis protein CapA/YwtB (metallophosphatase superfamily)